MSVVGGPNDVRIGRTRRTDSANGTTSHRKQGCSGTQTAGLASGILKHELGVSIDDGQVGSVLADPTWLREQGWPELFDEKLMFFSGMGQESSADRIGDGTPSGIPQPAAAFQLVPPV